MDWIDGVEVEPTDILGDEVIYGIHKGTIRVLPSGQATIKGTLQGTFELLNGSSAIIDGKVQGTVSVAAESRLVVNGIVAGTLHVSQGGYVKVNAGGSLRGTLSLDGTIENAGARGGVVSGNGELIDFPGSFVVTPVIKDGIHYYNW